MPSKLTRLSGARLIDDQTDQVDDLLLENGFILLRGREAIGRFLSLNPKVQVQEHDLHGFLVLPALADFHFHLRQPGQDHKETLRSGLQAALSGGYSAILAMANTSPVIDCKERLFPLLEEARSIGRPELYQNAAVSKGLQGKECVDFQELRPYTRFFSDDGRNIEDPAILRQALEASKEYDLVISDHSEPETEMVLRNLELVRNTRGRLHFCHISRQASMRAIWKAKEQGLAVTVEVTPHHLYASDLSYRVNPPFAEESDRLFLIEAIRQGVVDCIATDHAPHSEKDKADGAPGISGIESALGICQKVFTRHDLPMTLLARYLARAPHKMLSGKEARLREGCVADLAVVEEIKHPIDPLSFQSLGKNTPFAGQEMNWKVRGVYLQGERL